MPFQPCGTSPQAVLVMPVDGLKRSESEGSVVNPFGDKWQARRAAAINSAVPAAMAQHAETMRMHEMQQGFGASVADLLFQIRFHRLAAVMPHERPWRIPNRAPMVQQSPAKIDVI